METVSSAADFLIYQNAGTFQILYALNIIEHTVHYGDLSWMYNNLYYPDQLQIAEKKEEFRKYYNMVNEIAL